MRQLRIPTWLKDEEKTQQAPMMEERVLYEELRKDKKKSKEETNKRERSIGEGRGKRSDGITKKDLVMAWSFNVTRCKTGYLSFE